ncbi:MAG: hypothetical protein HOK97_14100 [Deltaproteobacteria bacterium]|jgi:hypothetical protein|nr:hypothetical protein [Deltaproteobacteria bacterium]
MRNLSLLMIMFLVGCDDKTEDENTSPVDEGTNPGECTDGDFDSNDSDCTGSPDCQEEDTDTDTMWPPIIIDALDPLSGPIGSNVVISGVGFSAMSSENSVSFGGAAATILSASETELLVTVPAYARHGPVTVMSNGLIARSSVRFNITFNATETFNMTHMDQQFMTPYLGSGIKDIGWGDLDGDGTPEIVTTQVNGDICVHTTSFDEDGMVSFERRLTLNYGLGPWAQAHDVALGDVDGDGRLDIVASEYGDVTDDFDSHTCIFINTGTGISGNGDFDFASPMVLSGDGYEGFAQLQDINGDGRLDIVTSRANWHQMGVYLNTTGDGAVSFAPKVIIDAYVDTRPAFADFNGDGLVDLVSSGDNRDVHIYYNRSTQDELALELALTVEAGGVEDPQYTYYWATGAPRLADLDGDGLLEIITRGGTYGGSPNGLSVMRNTSTDSQLSFDYEFEDYFEYENNSVQPLLIEIADLDGDGRSDIVTSDWLAGLSVWINASSPGTIALETQLQIGVGSFPNPFVMCDLNQDATPEIIVGHFDTLDGMRIIHNFLPVNAFVDPADCE